MPDRPNALYRNNGTGGFTKVTTGVQATTSERAHAGVWGDVNNDGWLDFFVANFANLSTPVAKDNALYRSDGQGGFVRQSFGPKTAGNDLSFNAAWGDFNNDGWLDLFVPQGGVAPVDQRSLLYRNDRAGNLALVPDSTITAEAANSIACAWGDLNNDGWLDLFVGRSYGRTNALYRNNGDGSFTAIADSVVTLDAATSGRGAWADYDNDGWLDLFVSNLGPIDAVNLVSLAEGNNALCHNNGDGTFTQITTGSLVNDGGYSTGCAWGDYDNDGFPDLFVANGWITASQNNFLYRNNGNTNSWLNLRLIGTVSNRSAIGAKVRVRATIGGKTVWQLREISGGGNCGSQNDLQANFGLGDATKADLVRIEWPSGTVTELRDVAPKRFLTVTESARLEAVVSNGTPQCFLQGGHGRQYDVETSTNLPVWSLLRVLTITNLNGIIQITDPNATSSDHRFYRAVLR